MEGPDLVVAFAVAGCLGAAIGLERQVAHKHQQYGARTFALYGIWGTGAAVAGDLFGPTAFAVFALGFMALVVTSTVLTARELQDPGTTTEAAEVAVFLVGMLAWHQDWIPAVMLAVATAVVLSAKRYTHEFADRVTQDDARVALQFAVVTGIVLPLVPNDSFGPWDALNPREIWTMVVVVSAIGLVGYIGLRLRGSRGIGMTGILGGLVSSTAVTLGLSRESRDNEAIRPALVAGIVGASALMYPRMAVEAAVTSPALAKVLLPVVLVLVVGMGAVTWWWFRRPVVGPSDLEVRNPLTLTVAIQFAVLYGVIVLAARGLVAETTGDSVLLLGLVSGIADVDAITLTAGNLVSDGLDERVGGQIVLLAATSNALVKAGLITLVGTRRLARSAATTLVAAAGATAIAAALL